MTEKREKYRAGVIGCSGVGTRHAMGLVGLPNVELVAGSDLIQNTLNSFKEKFSEYSNRISGYTNYQEMLLQENLDIVTVATSDHRHTDPVINAAEIGVKGVFCEKPLATRLIDADRMIEAVNKNQVILSIDHTRRWIPLWVHTKELVLGGEIGDIHYIIGTLGGSRAMLFRNGTHLIDMICYFANSKPAWVSAELEKGFENYDEYDGDGGHSPNTEPSAHGYIHFENGVRGFYVGGPKTTPSRFSLEIVGTSGYININDQEAKIYKNNDITPISTPKWDVIGIEAGVQNLVKMVDQGGEPVSSGNEALKTIEIIIGFLESQRHHNTKINLARVRRRMPG